MKGCPFEYQRHGSPRELSPENGERVNLNESLVFAVFGVEMCRGVVSKVHSNHNPKESSYLRHFFFRYYSLHARRVRRLIPFAIRTPRTHSFTGPGCRERRFTGGWANTGAKAKTFQAAVTKTRPGRPVRGLLRMMISMSWLSAVTHPRIFPAPMVFQTAQLQAQPDGVLVFWV